MANPLTLDSVSAAFAHWRQNRSSLKEPVPIFLREQAIKLLAHHSKSRVIQALKINHSMLKQWQPKGERSAATFVVLPPPTETASSLQITLRNSQGAEMRIAGVMSADRHGQIRVPLRYRHSPLPITQRLQLITVFWLA